MRITALFRIDPPAMFGLPDGDKFVHPTTEDAPLNFYGPTLDARTGQIVGHGSLPVYRQAEDAIADTLHTPEADFTFNDNFVTVRVEAPSLADGAARAGKALTRLLQHVMVEQGTFLASTLLQAESDSGEIRAANRPVRLMKATVFSLRRLRSHLQIAERRASAEDARLERALVYCEHGHFLFSTHTDIAPFASAHAQFLVASAFLSLWKAITSILGEPGTDRDYQRRYRSYGLPDDYWTAKVAPLKRVRDSADVAHYELDVTAIHEVQGAFPQADAIAREVIAAYSEHVAAARQLEMQSP